MNDEAYFTPLQHKPLTREQCRLLMRRWNDDWAALVTLDGERAKITGWEMDFAVVMSLESEAKAEFCWETVERIVNLRMARFKSK